MFAGAFVLFITLHAVLHATAANAKHKSDGKLNYPGPIKEYHTENRYGTDNEYEVPEECRGKNYCTIKPPDYPQEKFNKLIKTKIPISQPETVVSDIIDKQGDPDEVDNCETQIEFEPMYKVKAPDGVWRTVVQVPENNFVQKVRVETCRARDSPCFTVFPKIPTYTTFCKQKFTTWHIVVDSMDPNAAEKTEKIAVDLPTCCSCHYKPI